MAVDKLVDSTQLDACCTAEANAIRAKTGGSAQLAYDWANNKGFADAIAAIPSGGDTVYYTSAGVCYIEQMSTPSLPLSLNVNSFYDGATEMKSFSTQYSGQLGGSALYKINEWFKGCTKLEIAHFPNVSAIKNSYTDRPFYGCSGLKDFTAGSVGVSVTEFKTSNAGAFKFFNDLRQADLVITIFVAANSIAEISTDITSQAPWGATNATIVYRNSTTGEVITA